MNSQQKRKLKPAPLQPHPGQRSKKELTGWNSLKRSAPALTSWGRCHRNWPCRSALWGPLWISDPEGPGPDPGGYTPPPGGPRSTQSNTLPIWRSMHTWYHLAFNFGLLFCIDHMCLHFQAFYLICSALSTSGVSLSISVCNWSRVLDTSARPDKGISSETWEICVCMSPNSCLLSEKIHIHKHGYLFLKMYVIQLSQLRN